MSWKNLLFSFAAFGLLHSSASLAQGLPGGVVSPNVRFAEAPQVGEQFPDIAIVDEQGDPVSIRELASQRPYTVLTLGCLT